ncbi:MAG: hypothetical protein HYX90_09235 [Chloroflexi bacterium]|nr:hypothetical protein [Chloroflexota bacterium]
MEKTRRMAPWLVSLFVVALLTACSPAAKPTPVPSSTPTTGASAPTTSKPAVTSVPSPTASVVPTSPAPSVSFAGKTVTIIVPTEAGGGSDIMARVYSRHLVRFLPGNPRSVVRNMPGGAGTIGANQAFASRPDGLTALLASGSVQISYALGSPAAKYDLTKGTILVSTSSATMFYAKAGIVDKPENILQAKGIRVGGTTGSSGWLLAVAIEVLGIPTEKIVLGYQGTGDARRAYLSGEVNVSSETTTGYNVAILPYLERGEIVMLFQTGLLDEKGNIVKDPAFPSTLLTAKELYEKLYNKPPSGIAWQSFLGMVGALRTYGQTLALPAGVPGSIAQTYWTAVDRMVKDPEFKRDTVELVGDKGMWLWGELLDKAYKAQLKWDPAIVTWLKEFMSTKHGVVVE